MTVQRFGNIEGNLPVGECLIPRKLRGVRMVGIPYQEDVTDELAELMEQIAAGEIHLELEHVYAFDDALAALAKVQTRRARGKLVLRRE